MAEGESATGRPSVGIGGLEAAVQALLVPAVGRLCAACGFHSSHEQVLAALTDVTARFAHLLASRAAATCHHCKKERKKRIKRGKEPKEEEEGKKKDNRDRSGQEKEMKSRKKRLLNLSSFFCWLFGANR